LANLGFTVTHEKRSIRIKGGNSENVRFFAIVQPKVATKAKHYMTQHVNSQAKITDIATIEGDVPVYNLETTAGSFIADGFVTHNCCKNNPKVRLNSAERLIDEIGMLHDEYGYRAIAFPEDIFTLNKKRTVQVCEFLKRKGIVWRCLVRADLTVKYGLDFLDMMIDSGCIGVGIGIESGSNTILRNVNKAENIEQMHEAIAMLKSRHVFIKGFFIVGLPGETEETLAETERFLQRARLDDIDCKIFQPYPGSPIYDNKAAYDIDWDAMPLEYTFYKGRPGEYYGNVRTSALSSERLLEAWKHFEDTYKDWTNAIENVMVNEEDDDGLCV